MAYSNVSKIRNLKNCPLLLTFFPVLQNTKSSKVNTRRLQTYSSLNLQALTVVPPVVGPTSVLPWFLFAWWVSKVLLFVVACLILVFVFGLVFSGCQRGVSTGGFFWKQILFGSKDFFVLWMWMALTRQIWGSRLLLLGVSHSPFILKIRGCILLDFNGLLLREFLSFVLYLAFYWCFVFEWPCLVRYFSLWIRVLGCHLFYVA